MNDKNQTPDSIWHIFIRRPDLTEDSFYYQGAETREDAIDKLNAWQYWERSFDRTHDDNGEVIFSVLALQNVLHGAKKTSGRELLRHFCAAHDHGVFPPETIMNELYKLFSSYLEDNSAGKNRRLGEYFGEPPEGTPAASFKKEAVEGIMEVACDHVHRLRLWFKCSRSDALDIVSLKLLQVQKQLPWESKKLKGRAALEKEYDHYLRDYLPKLEKTGSSAKSVEIFRLRQLAKFMI